MSTMKRNPFFVFINQPTISSFSLEDKGKIDENGLILDSREYNAQYLLYKKFQT